MYIDKSEAKYNTSDSLKISYNALHGVYNLEGPDTGLKAQREKGCRSSYNNIDINISRTGTLYV